MTEIKCGRGGKPGDETVMYAAVVRFADGTVMRNNTLFTSPDAARRCMTGMESYLNGMKDFDGAKMWGASKFCIFPVKVNVPQVEWEAAS